MSQEMYFLLFEYFEDYFKNKLLTHGNTDTIRHTVTVCSLCIQHDVTEMFARRYVFSKLLLNTAKTRFFGLLNSVPPYREVDNRTVIKLVSRMLCLRVSYSKNKNADVLGHRQPSQMSHFLPSIPYTSNLVQVGKKTITII